MTVHNPTPLAGTHPEIAGSPGSLISTLAAKALAVLRIAIGFTFLWAFLDKTFGFGYATPSSKAWINGGSPTLGFLKGVEVGPFQSFFHSIAGAGWANVLFMLALLGVGVAMVSGIAMRAAAVSGVVLLGFMWLATYPLAQTGSSGAPTGSSNPIVDSHVLEALVLVVVTLTYAGTTWGLGRRWARLPFVLSNRWAL